jgi:hypothetical protein
MVPFHPAGAGVIFEKELMPMPGAEIAQYGIATFALAGLLYVVSQFLKQKGDQNLTEVVQNNTKALEQLTTLIQVSMTRQEAKMDELLERARR